MEAVERIEVLEETALHCFGCTALYRHFAIFSVLPCTVLFVLSNLLHAGEDLIEAVEREVLEETVFYLTVLCCTASADSNTVMYRTVLHCDVPQVRT